MTRTTASAGDDPVASSKPRSPVPWTMLAIGGAAAAAVGAWRLITVRRRSARLVRASRRADEEYAARQLIRRTLDERADLRRLAPLSRAAAQRYEELLSLELAALEELARGLRAGTVEPAAGDVLAEAEAELQQLRNEVAWCRHLLGMVA